MILLDTHIWIWMVSEPERLTDTQQSEIEAAERVGLGVSVISCWEVAKLVERGRIALDRPVGVWIEEALAFRGVRVLDLTVEIVIASTQLPGTFHRDPADQIIVATARAHQSRLLTSDQKILGYEHVESVS